MIFISNIMAFFTSSDSTSNRFRAVTPPEPVVQIAVTEEFEPPSEKTNEPFRKDVKITNTGTEICYVRVRLEISNYEFANLAYYSADGINYVKAENYITDLPTGWVYSDGFYYYTEPLAIGASTTNLLQWVKIDFPADSTVHANSFDIFVYAEAADANDSEGAMLTYQQAF
ncbi:MAG: hypothetical protein IJ874_00240 [Ruminococcus sp.]|nr:hypothetical protein [Ruminococcus sp.]